MSRIEIITLAIGLAMDASAVSLAAAAAGFARTPRAVFRLAFHFGLFQFIMPVAGWYAGDRFIARFSSVSHWIAFFLLCFVGIRMMAEGFEKKTGFERKDPSKGIFMVMLSIATSIDALAVGLSLAVLKINIWYPGIMIGVITGAMCVAAIMAGRRLKKLSEQHMEIAGGIILVIMGFKILISGLM